MTPGVGYRECDQEVRPCPDCRRGRRNRRDGREVEIVTYSEDSMKHALNRLSAFAERVQAAVEMRDTLRLLQEPAKREEAAS